MLWRDYYSKYPTLLCGSICVGLTTIAGGKWSRAGHSDGPSEGAKFSTDFEVVYIASSCSLLVVDRGNQAIREIQLNIDDCAHQYDTDFPLGIFSYFTSNRVISSIEQY